MLHTGACPLHDETGPGYEDNLRVTIEVEPGQPRLRAWDEFVRASVESDVVQLSGWARVRQLAGYEAMYVFVHAGPDLVGGAQVLVRRLPMLGRVGYVPYGPLIVPLPVGAAVEDALAAALERLGRRHLRALFVQPPNGAESMSASLLQRGFRPSDANIAPSTSLRIDLNTHEAELRRNLSRRLRGWTNRWEPRGVAVRQGDEDDLPLAAELHARTAEHHGFAALPVEYLAAMHRELSAAGHFLLLIGEVHGRPGVMGVYTGVGGVLKARLVGLDRSSDAARCDSVAAVDWAALTWAKRNGYRWFDFSGVSPASLGIVDGDSALDRSQLSGPDRYKLRFGAVPYRYPQPVELISWPLLRLGLDVVRRSGKGRQLLSEVRQWARGGSRPGHVRRPAPGRGRDITDRNGRFA